MTRTAKPTAAPVVDTSELTGWELELYQLHKQYDGRSLTITREGAGGRKWSGKLGSLPEGLSPEAVAKTAKDHGIKPQVTGLVFGKAKGKAGADALTGESAVNHANILTTRE